MVVGSLRRSTWTPVRVSPPGLYARAPADEIWADGKGIPVLSVGLPEGNFSRGERLSGGAARTQRKGPALFAGPFLSSRSKSFGGRCSNQSLSSSGEPSRNSGVSSSGSADGRAAAQARSGSSHSSLVARVPHGHLGLQRLLRRNLVGLERLGLERGGLRDGSAGWPFDCGSAASLAGASSSGGSGSSSASGSSGVSSAEPARRRPAPAAEGLLLLALDLVVGRAALTLQLEVLADGVVKASHGRVPLAELPRRGARAGRSPRGIARPVPERTAGPNL